MGKSELKNPYIHSYMEECVCLICEERGEKKNTQRGYFYVGVNTL